MILKPGKLKMFSLRFFLVEVILVLSYLPFDLMSLFIKSFNWYYLEKQSYSLGYEHMGDTLREFMGHSGTFNEELQKVELIDGDEELALFR